MWTKDQTGNIVVTIGCGDLVKARYQKVASFGVVHETSCGRWVKKIHAIRQGLELTGNRKQIQTGTHYAIVPA